MSKLIHEGSSKNSVKKTNDIYDDFNEEKSKNDKLLSPQKKTVLKSTITPASTTKKKTASKKIQDDDDILPLPSNEKKDLLKKKNTKIEDMSLKKTSDQRSAGVLEDLSPTKTKPVTKYTIPKTNKSPIMSKNHKIIQSDAITENIDVIPIKLENIDTNNDFKHSQAENQMNDEINNQINNQINDEINDQINEINEINEINDENYVDDTSGYDLLINKGYEPLNCVINVKDGIKVCKYIKASDDKGNKVYIDPDIDTNYNLDKISHVIAEPKQSSILNYSLKRGGMSMVTPDINGIAWECDSELCVISREGENLDTIERCYDCKDIVNLDINDVPIAYPVIKMSEIVNNGDIIHSTVQEVHDRLRNVEYEQCEYKLENLKESIKSLYEAVLKYDSLKNITITKLTETIDELDFIHSEYMYNGIVSEQHKINIEIIKHNLKIRKEKVVDLIKLCSSLNNRQQRIDQLLQEFNDFNNYAENSFKSIEFVYTP